jgi:hypothetical protein
MEGRITSGTGRITFRRLRHERNHRFWSKMKLRKARYPSPFTEVAGKGGEAFHRERECLESESRVPDLENICSAGEYRFAGWI